MSSLLWFDRHCVWPFKADVWHEMRGGDVFIPSNVYYLGEKIGLLAVLHVDTAEHRKPKTYHRSFTKRIRLCRTDMLWNESDSFSRNIILKRRGFEKWEFTRWFVLSGAALRTRPGAGSSGWGWGLDADAPALPPRPPETFPNHSGELLHALVRCWDLLQWPHDLSFVCEWSDRFELVCVHVYQFRHQTLIGNNVEIYRIFLVSCLHFTKLDINLKYKQRLSCSL